MGVGALVIMLAQPALRLIGISATRRLATVWPSSQRKNYIRKRGSLRGKDLLSETVNPTETFQTSLNFMVR